MCNSLRVHCSTLPCVAGASRHAVKYFTTALPGCTVSSRYRSTCHAQESTPRLCKDDVGCERPFQVEDRARKFQGVVARAYTEVESEEDEDIQIEGIDRAYCDEFVCTSSPQVFLSTKLRHGMCPVSNMSQCWGVQVSWWRWACIIGNELLQVEQNVRALARDVTRYKTWTRSLFRKDVKYKVQICTQKICRLQHSVDLSNLRLHAHCSYPPSIWHQKEYQDECVLAGQLPELQWLGEAPAASLPQRLRQRSKSGKYRWREPEVVSTIL